MRLHPHPRQAEQRGFTIPELLAGLLIFVLITTVLLSHLQVNYATTRVQKDKVFAFNKAQALLAEIQSFVDRGEIAAAVDLDTLDDGTINNPVLSIATVGGVPVPADGPLSGNYQRASQWMWSRRITVKPFTGLSNRNVRYVTVNIYKRDDDNRDRVMASLSSVVTSVGSAFPTTQVFDLYLLAVENIPGWWVFMEAIIPFVESAISDLEGRNPGMSFRTHWITKASYGRNPLYRPYVNEVNDSHQAVNQVYWYPGRMPAGNSSSFYYVPSLMRARLSYDGNEAGGYDDPLNRFPYALADFFNHAMREPQERALHDKRVADVKARAAAIATARANGDPEPPPLYDMSEEPTLRLFLEDLATDPAKYKNAMIINLHGELVPMPSLRNYSDAAKDARVAGGVQQVRVVTHPEELRTKREPAGTGVDDVVFRVYAYTAQTAAIDRLPATRPIALRIMGVDLTDAGASGLIAGCQLRNLPGGVTANGSNLYPAGGFQTALKDTDPHAADEMYYSVSFEQPAGEMPYTLFKLHRTPVVAPLDAANRGLGTGQRARLYNYEYVPSPPGATADFSQNLSFVSSTLTKNTARWTLRIPASVLTATRFKDTDTGAYYNPPGDVVLTARTHIWDPAIDADAAIAVRGEWPSMVQPENLSETYTWWTDSIEDVPFTERAQFQGDPRHCPYKDLSRTSTDFPNGYNWFHDSLQNTNNAAADFAGFLDAAVLRNRWQGMMRQDVPRFFQLLRTALVRGGTVYTTLTGWSYYYMGHGNEIGYDSANGYPTSIPVNLGPFGGGTGATGFTDNIIGTRKYVCNGATPLWWGIPWLGELCPDSVYDSQWAAVDGAGKVRGNLDVPAPSLDATHFARVQDSLVYSLTTNRAYGTAMSTAMQRTGGNGCMTFMNHEVAGGRFRHQGTAGTGTLVGGGLDLATNYNFPLPTNAPINRPFTFANTTAGAEEWNYAPYNANRYTGTLIRQYYDHPSAGYQGSGLVSLVDTANANAGYIVVTGISNSVVSGSSLIAKFSILAVVQSFMESGSVSLTHRLKMPPRVELEFPTDADEVTLGTIPVQYDISWLRWDGQKYTSATAGGFAETESEIVYVLMYSKDNGVTWLHMLDDSPASPGTLPTDTSVIRADLNAGGAETYNWDTSDSTLFPEGTYQLLVEGYRSGQSLHYSQHRMKVYLEAP